MPRMRKGIAYRFMERPNTRISKFRKKSFVRMNPHIKIARFEVGEQNRKFDYSLRLLAKDSVQVRQEAIESARMTAVRLLEKNLGKSGYFLKIMVYPFHILRENPLAAGAGADRMSTGMQKSFGKPIGVAAQVKVGQCVIALNIDSVNLELARTALKRSSKKMSCGFSIEIKRNTPKVVA